MPWPAGCRRLHRRYERKAGHFLAVTGIARALIRSRRLATRDDVCIAPSHRKPARYRHTDPAGPTRLVVWRPRGAPQGPVPGIGPTRAGSNIPALCHAP